jgi:hypothetical protein
MTPPVCAYCGVASEQVTGADIYPHRPDLAGRIIYRCTPCKAWVGCHPNTANPLGRLANAELRLAKVAAHAAFDPFWKAKALKEGIPKRTARGLGYQWLAKELGIDQADCHVGMFDVFQCNRVVEICNAHRGRTP